MSYTRQVIKNIKWPEPQSEADRKHKGARALGFAIGLTLSVALVFGIEALVVWLLLTELVGFSLSFWQVVGALMIWNLLMAKS